MKVMRGNLHVHSDQSDGTLPLTDIIRIATKCQLDFIGINDHHVICSENQYMNDVLVLMGTEFNSQHSHYLAYDSNASFEEKQVAGAHVIQKVKNSGGMGIIAHPFEKGSPIVSGGKNYPWQDWNVHGFDGIELWNQTSQWRDSAKSLSQVLWLWIFNRYKPFYSGACPEALSKWDERCQISHVTGVAGSDLHAPILALGYKILDYPMLLSAVNNYVLVENLSGEAKHDSAQLIAALKKGRCWLAFDFLHLGSDFSFTASHGDEQAFMGDTLYCNGCCVRLSVVLPHPGVIRVLHNGGLIKKTGPRKWLELSVSEPGVYRIEARLSLKGKEIPWIYSNPVYIK